MKLVKSPNFFRVNPQIPILGGETPSDKSPSMKLDKPRNLSKQVPGILELKGGNPLQHGFLNEAR